MSGDSLDMLLELGSSVLFQELIATQLAQCRTLEFPAKPLAG